MREREGERLLVKVSGLYCEQREKFKKKRKKENPKTKNKKVKESTNTDVGVKRVAR